jgi:hypothetical protein
VREIERKTFRALSPYIHFCLISEPGSDNGMTCRALNILLRLVPHLYEKIKYG